VARTFETLSSVVDEQADQLYAMTDTIAERIRKVGGTTLRSIGHRAYQRVLDNDRIYSTAACSLSVTTARCSEATRRTTYHDNRGHCHAEGLIEVWIDETERRTWFLFEATRQGDSTGH
jgi:starvation-inducible DNA-binding protein